MYLLLYTEKPAPLDNDAVYKLDNLVLCNFKLKDNSFRTDLTPCSKHICRHYLYKF